MKKTIIIFGMLLTLPMLVSAQPAVDSYLGTLITQGTTLLGQLLTFLIALAVVWFIWNVVRYTMSSDDADKEKAKNQMVWGIIAIAVIVSIWGIVGLLRVAFGVESGVVPTDLQNMIPGGAVVPATRSTTATTPVRFSPTENPYDTIYDRNTE